MLSLILFVLILAILAMVGPLVLGLLIWLWNGINGNSLSFEDAIARAFEIAYPHARSI